MVILVIGACVSIKCLAQRRRLNNDPVCEIPGPAEEGVGDEQLRVVFRGGVQAGDRGLLKALRSGGKEASSRMRKNCTQNLNHLISVSERS